MQTADTITDAEIVNIVRSSPRIRARVLLKARGFAEAWVPGRRERWEELIDAGLDADAIQAIYREAGDASAEAVTDHRDKLDPVSTTIAHEAWEDAMLAACRERGVQEFILYQMFNLCERCGGRIRYGDTGPVGWHDVCARLDDDEWERESDNGLPRAERQPW